jgi:phosphotriesterase-related protein
MVQTVTGDVTADRLGLVLPHEHIYLDGFTTALSPDLILDDPKTAREELTLFQNAGGTTIVELTIHGLNPDPIGLRAISEELGILIVAGTGFYWERFYPSWMQGMSVAALTRLLVGEIEKGIAGTDVRAGIIGEIGSGNRAISPAEESVFRAAAAAQRETGVPISTHAPFGRVGRLQAQLLEDAGADLSRVVIGHIDTVHDVEYHEELVRRGVWIAYDTIGRLDSGTDDQRADTVAEMVRRGHAQKILLSSDVCRRTHLHAYGGHGYDHVITSFLPRLERRGLDEKTLALLTRENPRRLLTRVAS